MTEPAAPATAQCEEERMSNDLKESMLMGGNRLISSAIVIKRAKKRRRYTSGTKGTQRLGYGFSKAGFRVFNSVAQGMDTFVKRSDESRDKRKDGLVRDALRNASRGVSDGFAELGKAPIEIADRINGGQVWKIARSFTPFFR